MKKVIIAIFALTLLFNVGQVNAADTQQGEQQCNILCRIQRMFTRNNVEKREEKRDDTLSPPPRATDSAGLKLNQKERISQAVTNGKITQAQADEALVKLEAIRVKQEELRTLEKSFAEWLKTNNISAGIIGPPPPKNDN